MYVQSKRLTIPRLLFCLPPTGQDRRPTRGAQFVVAGCLPVFGDSKFAKRVAFGRGAVQPKRGESLHENSVKSVPRRDLTPSTDSPRFLLCCILFFSVHQVRLLVRYDAEKRLLKQGKDASMKRPADVAPDQRTRNSLMSLWEACEDGKLEITRKMLLVSGRF